MSIIQLSGDEYIDNDVLNLTDHQIRELQRIGSLEGFSGLLEPNLQQSRKRGPMIVRYLVGARRTSVLVGLFRTMPIEGPQRKDPKKEKINLNLVRAMNCFQFADANDKAALDALVQQRIDLFKQASAGDNAAETAKAAYDLASSLIVYGNIHYMYKVVEA